MYVLLRYITMVDESMVWSGGGTLLGTTFVSVLVQAAKPKIKMKAKKYLVIGYCSSKIIISLRM